MTYLAQDFLTKETVVVKILNEDDKNREEILCR